MKTTPVRQSDSRVSTPFKFQADRKPWEVEANFCSPVRYYVVWNVLSVESRGAWLCWNLMTLFFSVRRGTVINPRQMMLRHTRLSHQCGFRMHLNRWGKYNFVENRSNSSFAAMWGRWRIAGVKIFGKRHSQCENIPSFDICLSPTCNFNWSFSKTMGAPVPRTKASIWMTCEVGYKPIFPQPSFIKNLRKTTDLGVGPEREDCGLDILG